MLRIGITGDPQHGKNALADGITAAAKQGRSTESSTVIAVAADYFNQSLIAFGDNRIYSDPAILAAFSNKALPESIAAATPLTFDRNALSFALDKFGAGTPEYLSLKKYLQAVETEPEILTHPITPENKETYRALLQWIGGKANQDLNRSIWYEEIARQADIAEAEGCDVFTVSGIRFPNDAATWRDTGGIIIGVTRTGMPSLFQDDPTEAKRNLIKTDFIVENNGSLQQLHKLGGQVFQDLLQGHTREVYSAQDF